MESDNSFEPSQKPKKIKKFNEDIIILNDDDSYIKNDNNEEINEINEHPIFTLTIELEIGKTEKIDIYQNSDPYNIANNFCIEHNLGISTFQYLKEKIEYLLDEFKSNNNLDVKKCMNDINKDFNDINNNNNYIIEENNENINQNNQSNKYSNNINNNDDNINKANKLDYFSYFLNKHKNHLSHYRNLVSSKTNDENNSTITKNKINKNKKRNKSFETNIVKKNKKEIQIRNDVNKYLDSKEKNNYNIDKKIANYYDHYKSSILHEEEKVDIKKINNNENNLSSARNKIKSRTNIDQSNIQEESYFNNILTKNEIRRKKSAYFRSYISSKNESIGRNKTSDNTNTCSTSKINIDSIITNRTQNRKLNNLSGMKFNNDNPIMLNNKTINNYGQYLFEKSQIEKKRKQNELNEIQRIDNINKYKSYSFMPQTNIKKNRNIHSKYLDNDKLILNNEEEKYDFKPKINNNYKTDLNFEQRQKIFNNLYKRKNEEMKKYYINNKYDEKGHELFKPKLISKQIKLEKNTDIFNKNYSYYIKYNNNKEQLMKKIYKSEIEQNNKNFCNKNNTNKIMDELYNKIFKKLFNELDSDHDDLITSLTINLNGISKSIIKILEPILKELKEDEQTLNCEEFILVMKRLFEDTPMLEKQKLINYYQTKLKFENNFNNNKQLKINKTPYHSTNLSSYYCNNINNAKNNYSTKSINTNEQNEFNIENIDEENNESNYSDKNDKEIENDISDISSGLDVISKYTFNNYLKQIKY